MIQISFLLTECLFALCWLLLRIAVWRRQKHIDWKREAMLLLMAVMIDVSVVRAIDERAGRSNWNLLTISPAMCCASAALPPLPIV